MSTPTDWCPECGPRDQPNGKHTHTTGYREHFECTECSWQWSRVNRELAQAAYEDACDRECKRRIEEG